MLRIVLNSSARFSTQHLHKMAGVPLKLVLEKLESFAPEKLAESWDNVGLLIEPHKQQAIKSILLTNDLTEPVMTEAVSKNVDMIISYHPPIFRPLKRITQGSWKERVVASCLANNIALYSPHTAWDKVPGGVNDWLAKAFGKVGSLRALKEDADSPKPGSGIGRIFEIELSLGEAIQHLKRHINTDVHVALAMRHSNDTRIQQVAICAGSGASVLKDVAVDLVVSGEMSHHEVLDFNHNNTSVLLCNHSNSERGFLAVFRQHLEVELDGQCVLELSQLDRDPLQTTRL